MLQQLDAVDWPTIQFEGELMPQSLSAISILIYRPLAERTLDWIWRLPHCKEVWKEGDADWCKSSAAEISDHLLDHRDEIITEIQERLGPHGFDAQATFEEWLMGLSRIRSLSSKNGTCFWIAGELSEKAESVRLGILEYLDRKIDDLR
jgi:hypothetical protein